jgi:hypothetical protein
MLFDVPFLPDHDYIRFLSQYRNHLNSIYFSLYQDKIIDARHKFKILAPDDLIEALRTLTGLPKFALVNSRVNAPEGYLDEEKIGLAADTFALFEENDVLDGIVFADAYYLRALSDVAPDLAVKLQAVPSINFMIDTPDRLWAILDFISTTHFRPPGKVFLDRSLNRNWDRLIEVVQWCRKEQPQLKIGLLANEGCLYQCPYKPAHDCLIAFSHMNMSVDTFGINQARGCIQILKKNPDKLFQSPFIRPEDVAHYEGHIDVLKLCGRTLGQEFLTRVIQAFIDKNYRGNLLDLLDASNWMADEVYLSNERLPEDFFRRMTTCSKNCRHCSICREYQDSNMQPLEGGFRDLRRR